MKEQWTKDLQKKMNGFEVPTIPEGLWEDIDAALETQPANTQHLTPITRYWRKACAAILLLLAIPTVLYLLQTKTPNPYPSPVNEKGGTTAHNIPAKENSERQETSPTLSIPSTKHIAKAIIPQTTTSETAIDNGSDRKSVV